MDENKKLKVRVSGQLPEIMRAIERWNQAAEPIRQLATSFDRMPAVADRADHDQIRKLGDRLSAQAADAQRITDLAIPKVTVRKLPELPQRPSLDALDDVGVYNPWADQAERDAATLDVLTSIERHLAASDRREAERDRGEAKRERRERIMLWVTGISALAAVTAAVLTGIAL